jgi:hypothetical protein
MGFRVSLFVLKLVIPAKAGIQFHLSSSSSQSPCPLNFRHPGESRDPAPLLLVRVIAKTASRPCAFSIAMDGERKDTWT